MNEIRITFDLVHTTEDSALATADMLRRYADAIAPPLQQVDTAAPVNVQRDEPAPEPAAAPKKKAKKKAAKKKAAPVTAAPSGTPTYEEMKEAVGKLVQVDRPKAVNLLASFGTDRLSGVPQGKWAEAIERAQSLVAGGE